MGIFFSRVYNYFYSTDEIVYSRELCISLPITQNDIYKENNIFKENKIYKETNKEKKSYVKNEIIEI